VAAHEEPNTYVTFDGAKQAEGKDGER